LSPLLFYYFLGYIYIMLALYRKYRPATFADLIGHEVIVRILQEAARQDRIAHAYLFSGPRGTGKTTIARLIAKIANCEARQKQLAEAPMSKGGQNPNRSVGSEPCNACHACKSIDIGNALDVIEIDAASNRGIDEMRALKEHVRVSPSVLKHKVFIIDEAHQLTKEAANALLKTLEEPPSYVIIILATTEIEKIPATIASRTQKFQFKHPTLKIIIEKLKKIASAEKIKISDDALELIASSGEGSFRDAESLLDQMISLKGNEITTEAIESTLGKVGFHKIANFAEKILKGELEGTLDYLSNIAEEGTNLVQLTKDLIIHFRNTAVLKFDPMMSVHLENELVGEHLQKIKGHSKLFKNSHIETLKNLLKAYGQMRYSNFPIIPLEIALIESLNQKTA